jgi:type IV pilus assembly protein PilA
MEQESRSHARLGSLEFTLLAVGLVLLLLLGVRFALSFVKFGHREISSEVKSNLKALYTAQRAYLQEKDRYGQRLQEIGFEPERGNRYAYFLLSSGPIALREAAVEPRLSEAVIVWSDRYRIKNAPAPTDFAGTGCPLTPGKDEAGRPLGVGVWGTFPHAHFIAAAAANLDRDPTLECWSIASMPRVDAYGNTIPAGQPYLEQADLSQPTRWERVRKLALGPLDPG